MRWGMLLWLLGLFIAGTGSAGAVHLAYRDTPGAARWYRTQIIFYGVFTVQPENRTYHINGTAGFTDVEKVLAVDNNGIASLQTTISDGSVFLLVPELDRPPVTVPISGITVNYHRSPAGKVTDVSVKGLPAPLTQMPGMNFNDELKLFSSVGTGLEFPTEELHPGDTWTTTTHAVLRGQTIDVKYANTLREPRLIDQVSYQQIASTLTVQAPALTFQVQTANGQTVTVHEALNTAVKTTTLFNAAAGELFSMWLDGDSHFTITTPRPATGQTVTVTGTLHLSGGMRKIAPPAAGE